LGAEPQLQLERPVPTSLPGATNPNRGFIDWPYSSRTGTDILNRTLDGGNTWRPLVDFSCAVRNKPSCATHGGGDSINRVNLYDGTVYFGEQEEVANEALSSSTDHGDSFPTSRQHAISNAATGVDRQWIATVDAPNVTAAAGPEGTPVTLNAFYSYHIPAAGEYIQGVDSNGLLIPQPAPQIASVSQSGPSRVDENPKSPGKGYVYVSFRDTNGFEVASAPVSQYYLPTAWTVGHVSADTPAIFPWINLDRSGNLYAVWVTNGIVYYSYSLIGDPANNPHAGGTPATKWSPRIRVSPMGLGSTVFPEVVAGDPGRIAVAYDGTSDYTGISDGAPLNARWQTYASVVTDALSPHPDILTGAVSHRVIHTGSICTSGTTCTGDRSLLDMIDVQVDSQGRIGVVFTDNNNQMARDTGTAAQSTCTTSCKGDPFVEFAKITKGPSLLASVGKFKTSVPLNSRAAPAGDAKWPNTAAGVNLKSLDLRGASVTVHKGKLVATIKVASTSSAVMKADIASFNAASQGGVPYTGIQATRLSYVLTYQTAWKSASKPGDEYYLVYQFNSDGSHSSFGGKLDGTNATTGSVNAVTYNTKAAGGSAVKGKISGNTIMLSADDGHFAAEEGSRIYSVSAFSLAGPAQNLEVSASTISRMIDETPPFDAQFKRR
ncbi:MAG TPA: hypothetical protein VG815_11915, partial [Chloroflexota bacterium]|nr:hypothetical protein [Chloroflexota bacterium]